MTLALDKRWVLLEHIGDPNDSKGFHFDLLLEDQNDCLTWRLNEFPLLDGPGLPIVSIPAHKLSWLDVRVGRVSGGRGWAYRIIAGEFKGPLPHPSADFIQLDLIQNGQVLVILEIEKKLCKFRSVQSQNLSR